MLAKSSKNRHWIDGVPSLAAEPGRGSVRALLRLETAKRRLVDGDRGWANCLRGRRSQDG